MILSDIMTPEEAAERRHRAYKYIRALAQKRRENADGTGNLDRETLPPAAHQPATEAAEPMVIVL